MQCSLVMWAGNRGQRDNSLISLRYGTCLRKPLVSYLNIKQDHSPQDGDGENVDPGDDQSIPLGSIGYERSRISSIHQEVVRKLSRRTSGKIMIEKWHQVWS
jgi:hypothetical protein